MKTTGPTSGRTAGNTAPMTLAALMLLAVMSACSGSDTPPGTTTPQAATATAAPAETASPPATASATAAPLGAEDTGTSATDDPDTEMCREGDAKGERLNDLAEHVYDGAVARYLLENASGIGREITAGSEAYALMLLGDDEAYDTCIELPERCLRAEFLRTSSQEERDALLSGPASYAYEKALACLQRAGDSYADERPAPEMEAGNLEVKYRERILPRLIGNMMPVALLADSSFFGTDNQDVHRIALEVWQACLQEPAPEPMDPEQLVERISQDMTAVLDCVEELHAIVPEWAERPDMPGDETQPNTPTPTGKPGPPMTLTPAMRPATPGVEPEVPQPTSPAGATGYPDALPGDEWTRATARNRNDGEVFSVMLPPGWELTAGHGIDSYVGEIRGDGVLLSFDIGWYSHEPRPERDPHNDYVVLHEDIDGHRAKLVLAADPPTRRKENHWAATTVYFGHLPKQNRFLIAGEGLTWEQQKTAIAIFRSVRFAAP